MSQAEQLKTRDRMLAIGRQILAEEGCRGVTVRKLSQRANTNPGSFVYHFETREAFLSLLLEEWYQPLFAGVKEHAHDERPAAQRLETILMDIMEFLIEHGTFIAHLVLDVLSGEQAAIRFVARLPMRHPSLVLQTIQEAQQEGSIVQGDPLNILIYTVSCGGAPFILSGQLEVHDSPSARPLLSILGSLLTNPEAARQRMQWALRGILV